ncbi:MAG: penicillin-binding transpeptidase domain-containing protein [Solirubrobacteraceae bacterium]
MTTIVLLAACGSSATPQGALEPFLRAWSRGDWAAMRALVADPPADFAAANAAVFSALGVSSARFAAGRVRQSGARASALVTERFALPHVGTWSPGTTVRLVQRDGRWLVAWTPGTINPALRVGDRLAASEFWPARAPILGAGAVPLTIQRQAVVVGIVGSRIRSTRAVTGDLLGAGATQAQVRLALAQAEAHPDYFDAVFEVSKDRFEQLKAQPGSDNVYAVPGTEFQLTEARSAISPQLAAHVVGTVGPITAEQLEQLGPPYSAAGVVGQSGLEQQYERQLAGEPRTEVTVLDASGAPVATLASFAGHPGQAIQTSIDPKVQRAAEAALSSEHRNVALVAINASTGQILALVSDPVAAAYDDALQGEYPPGSTFKVLTATALIRRGLSPSSSASCPTALTIDGETFHNAEGEHPIQTLDQAFTESCNTAFIELASTDLTASDFTAAARMYGLQRVPAPGLPAFLADVPPPTSQTALAGTAIGQAGVVFSPLGMATVAAAVDSGIVRAPVLVRGVPDDHVAAVTLPANVVSDLQLMMAHVVSNGTAAGTGLPSTTHAKTGTAEYGSGSQLRTDAWLMGYDGNIAFAIVVQNSGGINGGPLDGPLIAKFLDALSPALAPRPRRLTR